MAKKKSASDAGYAEALKRIEACRKSGGKTLDLNNLELTRVPPEIGQLSTLEVLQLFGNQLRELPPEIGQLSALDTLYLIENQLSELPPEIGQLSALSVLQLDDNQLCELPPELGQLSELSVLTLNGNQLSELPPEIGRLSQLQILILEGNRLRELPESLRGFEKLKYLLLHGNEALELPGEVLGPTWSQSATSNPPAKPRAILDYYFSRRIEGEAPMREVRLLLVGRGRVGKTSLLKALRGEKPDRGEKETPGITVQPLELKCKKGTATGHVWDFGGQEFLHGTHQIFLAERCVYLLVLEGRDGNWETETDYWIRFIQSFGGDSPVIVVLTKYAEHPFSIDRVQLQERCPQIVGFVETDAFTRHGITKLMTLLKQTVNEMPDVWLGVSKKWHRIKEQLTRMNKSFLEYEDYQKLCQDSGLEDAGHQDSLAQTMHRLGIALNFREHHRLRETCVLKPEWVTEAIYGLIRFVQKKDCHGVMQKAWMPLALKRSKYPIDKHNFVLELMQKFEVAFQLDGTATWLIPELLREEQPAEFKEFRGPKVQRLRFSYPDAMPPGLLPRFIVRTHEMSAAHPNWRWRSGVVLQWQKAQALVRLNRIERRTEVAVIGGSRDDQQSLFDLIRAHLTVLHGKVRALEEIELDGHPDTWVAAKKLRQLETKGTRQTEELTKEGELATVEVVGELDGVQSPEARVAKSARPLPQMRLFVSYAHKDAKKIEPLSTHLTILGERGYIQTWDDRQLIAGEEWEDRILEELDRADIVVLLYSTNSRASKFIQKTEAPRAVQRASAKKDKATLIVVPLNRKDWDPNVALEQELKKFQAATRNAKPITEFRPQHDGWLEVERSIRDAVELRRKKLR
jgi:internalin A